MRLSTRSRGPASSRWPASMVRRSSTAATRATTACPTCSAAARRRRHEKPPKRSDRCRQRPMQTYRARRVLRTEPSGSSWPLLVETDAGIFYTKLKGAAQAPTSLVAETIVGGLADALALPVPARVLIELLPDVCIDDPRYELRRLVRASAGLNLGF